jgi:hypothetical protein
MNFPEAPIAQKAFFRSSLFHREGPGKLERLLCPDWINRLPALVANSISVDT